MRLKRGSESGRKEVMVGVIVHHGVVLKGGGRLPIFSGIEKKVATARKLLPRPALRARPGRASESGSEGG
jgi:hypothetical protein